jgi:predicted HD phosphohydrolase
VQAAAAALRDRADENVVLACLLRDISHLLALEAGAAPGADACATLEHARLGAMFLGAIGFSDDVCWMVRHHMDAARFLWATDPTYAAALSPGRVEALQSAGGPMPPEQCKALETDARWPKVLSMLTYDQVASKRVQRVAKEQVQKQHEDWLRYLDKMIREHLRKNLLDSPLQKKILLPDGVHAGSLLKIKDNVGGGAERRYEIMVPSGVGAGDVLRVILPGSERQMSSAFPLSQYARSYVLSWHQLRRLDEDGFVLLRDVLHPETVSSCCRLRTCVV